MGILCPPPLLLVDYQVILAISHADWDYWQLGVQPQLKGPQFLHPTPLLTWKYFTAHSLFQRTAPVVLMFFNICRVLVATLEPKNW